MPDLYPPETLERIALRIENNKKLKTFLKANKAEHRKAIYDSLQPYLRFKSSPFWLLNA